MNTGCPASCGLLEQLGIGQAQDRQPGIVGVDGRDHGGGLLGVLDDSVVERAVRLHVVHRGSYRVGHAVQGSQLVQHIAEQFVEGHVQGTPAKPCQVPVSDVRSYPNIEFKTPHGSCPAW